MRWFIKSKSLNPAPTHVIEDTLIGCPEAGSTFPGRGLLRSQQAAQIYECYLPLAISPHADNAVAVIYYCKTAPIYTSSPYTNCTTA